MESPNFNLEVYEGPLDLLLALIAKNKIDIYDIPIALILDQYLKYLENMRRLDMDVTSEFIVMAAELIHIKSKTLLPKVVNSDGEEEDPKAALVRALLEYKRAKESAVVLSQRYSIYSGRISKDTEVIDRGAALPESMDIAVLEGAFMKLLRRNTELPRLAKESEQAIKKLLKTRVIPVAEKVITVIRKLYNRDLPFEEMFERLSCRSELFALFSAILELVRTQRVTFYIVGESEDVILHLNKTHDQRKNDYRSIENEY